MIHILPKPQSVRWNDGIYELSYDQRIVLENSCGSHAFYHTSLLRQEILEACGMELAITRGHSQFAAICLRKESMEQAEAYHLSIQKTGITIAGGSDRGLLYGIQTLRQVIRQAGPMLPLLEIWDEPVMPNRGFYHDVTRGRIPTLASLKELADTLSFYKMNQLQLYIEHSYMFEGLSEMWRDDTPITAEEIQELDAYCANLEIELVPSLSSFGHLYKLLCTKSYAHLCEMPDSEQNIFSFIGRMEHHTLNVTMEESYQLAIRLIEEYRPLFTSKQFNIGADETFDLGKGKSKTKADAIGVDRLYINYVKRLCNYLVEQGCRPMFWGDVICGFPELIKELPEETICLNWGYAWNQNEDGTRALAEAGAVQYVCPGTGGWNMLINLMESSYQNIKRMCRFGNCYHAIGMLNTDWGDFGHLNHPANSIPGLIYGAEFSWNQEDVTFEELNRGISRIQYGDTQEQVMAEVAEICDKSTLLWEIAVRFQEMTERKETKDKVIELLNRRDIVKQLASGLEQNKEIRMHKAALKYLISQLLLKDKSAVNAYLLAADGMILFNEIGLEMLEYLGLKEDRCLNSKELAARLENWFYYYKKLWRSVSKESELYRIEHVIHWYADFLRDRKESI